MTVTLNLKPELEAGILAQAQATGMTVEEYLLSVVASAVLPMAQQAFRMRNERRRLKRGLLAIGRRHPFPTMRSAVRVCTKAAKADACPG
jgi:hypothetical protein